MGHGFPRMNTEKKKVLAINPANKFASDTRNTFKRVDWIADG
ncbi:unnamed protein product [marine sediment metagenome]|uniref:Uncharacterized protein n=1 Tax=marine sediment metagenome TaxID=412755 RepID=X0YN01_9ZZZZ